MHGETGMKRTLRMRRRVMLTKAMASA